MKRTCWPAVVILGLLSTGGCGNKSFSDALKKAELDNAFGLQKKQPPELGPFRPLTILPGEEKSVPIDIRRKENPGPIQVDLTNVPEGMTAVATPVAEKDSSSTLTLSAMPALGDSPIDARITVTISCNEQTASAELPVRVPRVRRPEIKAQEALVVQPGNDVGWEVPLIRNGFTDEIPLTVESSSTDVSASVSTVPQGDSTAHLRITVGNDAPDGDVSCRLEWPSYGRVMTSTLPIKVSRHPFALPRPLTTMLRPGERQERALEIQRTTYDGPIALTVEGLPAGIRVMPQPAPDAKDSITLLCEADATAKEGVVILPLHATAGHLDAAGCVSIRILGATNPTSLPDAVAASLESVARPRPGGVDSRRFSETKRALTSLYGTTPESSLSALEALRWLASLQADDGGWNMPALPSTDSGDVSPTEAVLFAESDRVAIAATAILPFLAEGLTHREESVQADVMSEFPPVVERTLSFIAQSQSTASDDTLGRIGGSFTAHVNSMIALSEAFALSGDERLKRHAKRAADYLLGRQGRNGGWAGREGVTSFDTASACLALETARICGVGVQKGSLRKALKYLDSCHTPDAMPAGSLYSLRPGNPFSGEATAACLLTSAYTGSLKDAPELLAGCDFLLSQAPRLNDTRASHPIEFFLLASQILQNVEGERFDAWNAALRWFLTSHQVKQGPLTGSWNPQLFTDEVDRISTTAYAVLCLQSHFRYLPLLRLPESLSNN